jgi:hypothetical protein
MFFDRLCHVKQIAAISEKPYKIRSMTMKNFVENALNLVKNSPKNWVKSPMLKWVNQGGGGTL